MCLWDRVVVFGSIKYGKDEAMVAMNLPSVWGYISLFSYYRVQFLASCILGIVNHGLVNFLFFFTSSFSLFSSSRSSNTTSSIVEVVILVVVVVVVVKSGE